MAQTFPCPHCETRYGWKAELEDRRVKCKKCGESFSVPALPRELDSGGPEELPQIVTRRKSARSTANSAGHGPSAADLPMTLESRSVASNPGRLKMQLGKYLTCYPWESLLILCVGTLAGCVAIPFLKAPATPVIAIAAGAAGGLLIAVYRLIQRKEQFWHGCTCPAVVISTKPPLIAAAADLATTSRGYHPAIKIIRQPLSKMTGGPADKGMRLATVAVYQGNPESAHWSNFHPQVVNCATTNERDIERVLESIPQEEWDMLDLGLDQLPENAKCGKLFFLT